MMPDQIIQSCLEIINPVLKEGNNTQRSFPVEFTFHQVLERIKCNLDSIKILLKHGILNHDHAIGLISRNLLTDFITTGYIIKMSTSEEERFVNLYSLYNSDLERIDSVIYTLKDVNIATEAMIVSHDEKYKDDTKLYKIVREYCIEFNVKKFPSTTDIIKKFNKSDLNDNWSELIKRSYDSWIFYSKYEHLGLYSYELTRNITSEKAIGRLNSVLFKTLVLQGSCLEILQEKSALRDSIALMNQINSA